MRITTKRKTTFFTKAAALKDSIERKGKIAVCIRNNEFYPTILEGDMAEVTNEQPQNLMIGDAVLLIGKIDIVVRRVVKIMRLRGGVEFLVASNRPGDMLRVSGDRILGRIMDVSRGTAKVKFDIDITFGNFLFIDLRILFAKLLRRNSSRIRNSINRNACMRLREDSGIFVA